MLSHQGGTSRSLCWSLLGPLFCVTSPPFEEVTEKGPVVASVLSGRTILGGSTASVTKTEPCSCEDVSFESETVHAWVLSLAQMGYFTGSSHRRDSKAYYSVIIPVLHYFQISDIFLARVFASSQHTTPLTPQVSSMVRRLISP